MVSWRLKFPNLKKANRHKRNSSQNTNYILAVRDGQFRSNTPHRVTRTEKNIDACNEMVLSHFRYSLGIVGTEC